MTAERDEWWREGGSMTEVAIVVAVAELGMGCEATA